MNIYNWIGVFMLASIPAILIMICNHDESISFRLKLIGLVYVLIILFIGGIFLSTLK